MKIMDWPYKCNCSYGWNEWHGWTLTTSMELNFNNKSTKRVNKWHMDEIDDKNRPYHTNDYMFMTHHYVVEIIIDERNKFINWQHRSW